MTAKKTYNKSTLVSIHDYSVFKLVSFFNVSSIFFAFAGAKKLISVIKLDRSAELNPAVH